MNAADICTPSARPARRRRRSLSRRSAPSRVWGLLEAEAGTWWTLEAIAGELHARYTLSGPTVHRAVWRLVALGLVERRDTAEGLAAFGVETRDGAEDRMALWSAGYHVCRHCPAGFPSETGRRVHESRWCGRMAR